MLLEDIIEAIERIERYAAGTSFEGLRLDGMKMDAIVRNLEIVGEAARHLPEEFRSRHAEIEWNRIIIHYGTESFMSTLMLILPLCGMLSQTSSLR